MHALLINDDPGDIALLISVAGSLLTDVEGFTIDQIQVYAEAAGLDMALFSNGLDSETLMEKVRLLKQEAVTAGVKTATIFVNGQEYNQGHSTIEEFYVVIDEELERLEASAVE